MNKISDDEIKQINNALFENVLSKYSTGYIGTSDYIPQEKKCNCDIVVLLRKGCQCGGM